ncbi:MAG TPA: L-seryl-tRNA(Sec) selenium transferase [Deferrisomatales bacterium]|nr:L-seryl-tRNA(Sec) selenium transferase [Deferrisomatales bacterium]
MSAVDNDRQQALRQLPSVERVLQCESVRRALAGNELPRTAVLDGVRGVLAAAREAILAGGAAPTAADTLAAAALDRARVAVAPHLVGVINATGVILHTNLGRAPLAPEAVAAMLRAAGYCNLEYDLVRGARGSRHDAVEGVLREVTGAEAALVVNNNAAAVLLGLTALARGREVVVSRGELVEIGGAFRIPEVMAQGGAILREVGSTNKTKPLDYERAIGPDTALLLKVHTSNYRILGFTASVALEELVALGHRQGVAVMEDLGGGCLMDLGEFGIEREPTVQDSVRSGADLVTFSGDKLLGGPQAGILVGHRDAVEACGRHPLMRALRPDKVTLAALEATLALYRDGRRARERIPTLMMLAATGDALRDRAEQLAADLRGALGEGAAVAVAAGVSEAGGGSLPLQGLPTWVVEVRRHGGGTSRLEAALRRHDPPVIARVHEDALVLDPRTVAPDQEPRLVDALAWAWERAALQA